MYEVNEERKLKLDMKVGGIEGGKVKIFHFVQILFLEVFHCLVFI
jgi:hypothetical protein